MLHQGIAAKTGRSIGTVVIVFGLVILVFWIPLRQRPGLGTVLNTLTVGLVIDLALHVVPEPELLAWVMGAEPTPAQFDTAVFRKMRDFRGAA